MYHNVVGYLFPALLIFQSLPLATCTRPTQPADQKLLISQPQLNATFRDITESDLADFTTIMMDAFSPGEDWKYIMPSYPKHKSELWYCLHQQVLEGWREANKTITFGKVITVPVSEPAGPRDRAVSLAIWNSLTRDTDEALPVFIESTMLGDLNCSSPPGVNTTRANDLDRQSEVVMQKYIYGAYDKQLYLNLLATHPDWDGNGFAAKHLQWGMELAQELDVPVTLFATPAGWPLYDSVGFESVKNVTFTLLDGLGTIWHEIMRWKH